MTCKKKSKGPITDICSTQILTSILHEEPPPLSKLFINLYQVQIDLSPKTGLLQLHQNNSMDNCLTNDQFWTSGHTQLLFWSIGNIRRVPIVKITGQFFKQFQQNFTVFVFGHPKN